MADAIEVSFSTERRVRLDRLHTFGPKRACVCSRPLQYDVTIQNSLLIVYRFAQEAAAGP